MAPEHAALSSPLISKLEAWGYEGKCSAPLVDIVGALDSPALALIECLSNDLTHVNERSHDLRVKVANLTDSLHKERRRVEQLTLDNENLQRDKDELIKAVQDQQHTTDQPNEGGNGDMQLDLWRAQSIHQLQELENMNQALRATLSSHSCCATTDETHGPARITISKLLAHTVKNPPPLKDKIKGSKQKTPNLKDVGDVKYKLLEDELKMWKEKHSILEDELRELTMLPSKTNIQHQFPTKTIKNDANKNVQRPATQGSRETLDKKDVGTSTNLQLCKLEFSPVLEDLSELFEDYEKDLIALATAHLADIEDLIRQGASNMNVQDVTLGNQVLCEMIKPDGTKPLQLKKKQHGPADFRKDALKANISVQKSNEISEGLDRTLGQKIIQMIKSVISFRDSTAGKVETMRGSLEEMKSVLELQKELIASLRLEVAKKREEISFIMDEKVVGEEALQASQVECGELASLIKEIDGSMVQLTTALATRTFERDKESEARMSTEQQLRKRYSGLLSQLDEARNQVINLQSETKQNRAQQQQERSEQEALSSELKRCIERAEGAERDVEQLKTLIIQLDSTREDLVGKLKFTMLNYQQSEKHRAALEKDIERLRSEVEIRTAEVSHSCGLLEVIGNERTHFECELNHLREKFSIEEANRTRVEQLWNSKSSEYQAAAEELASLKGEHQLLKVECIQLHKDNDTLLGNLTTTTVRVNELHQALTEREKEQENLLRLYQGVSDENHHIKVTLYNLDQQMQELVHQHQSTDMAKQKAEEQVKHLVAENERLLLELKGMKRQGDLMTRSLNQQSGLISDYEQEKEVLLSQLSAAKVAMADLESNVHKSTMEVRSLEEKNQNISDSLQSNKQEMERLSASYSFEQERVRSLENLLACVRAEEQKLEMASKEALGENALLKERIGALQEQVNQLQIARNVQNQDIFRLQFSKNKIEGARNTSLCSPTSLAPSNDSLDLPLDHLADDLIASRTKVQELEKRICSVTADLTKTTTLYKDCFSKLQKAESRFLELREEFDQMLTLLSKVEEERMLLQNKCAELQVTTVDDYTSTDKKSLSKYIHPDIEWMQKECHRLKKATSVLESATPIAA